MNVTRVGRLLYLAVINGFVLFQSVKIIRAAIDVHQAPKVLGGTVAMIIALSGFLLELRKARCAKAINLIVPVASSTMLLGAALYLRFIVREPEATQVTAILLLLSVVPGVIAVLTLLVYRMTVND